MDKNEEKILILLGKAGSGKGTQSEFLKENYKLFHISTGDIIRENIKNGTDLGKKVKEFSSNGKLVPDEIINKIVLNKVSQMRKENLINREYNGFIFDGFPRTAEQMEFLINNILDNNSNTYVLDYILDDDMAKQRIKHRAQEMGEKARKDDLNENSIQNRLAEYNKNHSAILDVVKSYKDIVNIIVIDASKSKKEICDETTKCINSKNYLEKIHNSNTILKNTFSINK